MPSSDQIWAEITQKIEPTMAPQSYQTWVGASRPVSYQNDQLLIEVPSDVHKTYWTKTLAPKFMAEAYALFGKEIFPEFVTTEELEEQQATQLVTNKSVEQTSLPLVEEEYKNSLLNPKYTFENFVVGKGSQMPHAAALVVADDPGSVYNPLFIYGGAGLGKTHLMHAIGHQMLKNQPNARIKYVSSESFTNEFIKAIQTNKMEDFRNEYRKIDLLLVDDIQFLENRVETQNEFFNTFEELYQNNKQIVLTSDRLPSEIPSLPDRLVSRFAWGLPVDITPPDLETRIAILRNKAEAEGLEIPEDTLSYIAGQFDSNVRELEGALVRVQAYATINNQEITVSLAAEALKSLKSSNGVAQVSILQIQEEVAKYYHISLKDLKGKKRVKSIVVPRQIAMYLSREMTENSLPKIGAEFGGKDHTTVIHAHEKIQQLIDTDGTLQTEVAEIKNLLLK